MVSLITYRDGEPMAIQAVTLQTNGAFEVGEYVEIRPRGPEEEPEGDARPWPGGA
jgi:hypothetical protein